MVAEKRNEMERRGWMRRWSEIDWKEKSGEGW
jgi:hypothetical protein